MVKEKNANVLGRGLVNAWEMSAFAGKAAAVS
jgi:hypothetical protein